MEILDTRYHTEVNLWELERSLAELKKLDDKLYLYIDELKIICKNLESLLEVISDGKLN